MKKFSQILGSYNSKQSKDEITEFDIFDFLNLLNQWKQVVSPVLAQNSIPLKLTQNTLTIITSHSTISSELNNLSEMIKADIIKKFPNLKNKIKKITFQNNPIIFNQLKNIEVESELKTQNQKAKLNPFSPEFRQKKVEALELYGDILEGDLDPELKEILLNLKLKS